jgi:hypothetical protein
VVVVKVVGTGDSATNDVTTIMILDSNGDLWSAGNSTFIGRNTNISNSNVFAKVQRNTDGKKVMDIHAFGNYRLNSTSGFVITLEDGSIMSTGQGGQSELGNNYTTNLTNQFKYVLGFEPGSKGNFTSVTTNLNSINGAIGNNTIENAAYNQNWMWNSLATTTGLTMSGSALTTGSLLALNSTGAAQTGSILNITASGGASSTGVLELLSVTSSTSAQKALQLLNIGTGLSLDVQGAVLMQRLVMLLL